ncbi:hypothetical protein AURDEDRAFT_172229 [Auricularia subglabra TFB-10046 SS5]|nr:hypothetical protein AURDEDRAFT_172229 [Auricularia subglabra TFB-10046 SS5]
MVRKTKSWDYYRTCSDLVFQFAWPLMLPPALVYLLCVWLLGCFYALEGVLESQYRDKYGCSSNAGNKAAELPQEVQLRIFHLHRTRAKFGEDLLEMDLFNMMPFSAHKDLAAVRLVCLEWHDAATEALYTDVNLHEPHACVAFSSTLLMRPELARLVRRVAFPQSSRDLSILPTHAIDNMAINSKDSETFRFALTLKLAIKNIVRLCDRAEDLRFFKNAKQLKDVSGIVQCASHVAHLSLRLRADLHEWWQARELDLVPRTLPVDGFPRLQTLTLQNHALDPLLLVPLIGLQTLRLSHCVMELSAFHALLIRLPHLRSVFWRNHHRMDAHSMGELFGPHHGDLKLEELTLIGSMHRETELSLHDLHTFHALRKLTITARMLSSLNLPPPSLARLTITFAPFYLWDGGSAKEHWLGDLLDVVGYLVHRVPEWREMWSPDLGYIGIWDVVSRRQL